VICIFYVVDEALESKSGASFPFGGSNGRSIEEIGGDNGSHSARGSAVLDKISDADDGEEEKNYYHTWTSAFSGKRPSANGNSGSKSDFSRSTNISSSNNCPFSLDVEDVASTFGGSLHSVGSLVGDSFIAVGSALQSVSRRVLGTYSSSKLRASGDDAGN
jgi:hypothetical protein